MSKTTLELIAAEIAIHEKALDELRTAQKVIEQLAGKSQPVPTSETLFTVRRVKATPEVEVKKTIPRSKLRQRIASLVQVKPMSPKEITRAIYMDPTKPQQKSIWNALTHMVNAHMVSRSPAGMYGPYQPLPEQHQPELTEA